jgi:parallel beta-helix repeat protein
MLTLTLLVGTLGLSIEVQRVEASGTIYIRADGSIDPPTAPISTVDNVTYTFTGDINDSIVIERDKIVVDGSGYTVQGTNASYTTGIDLTGRSNVTIQNAYIKNFSYGILLDSSANNSINSNNITNNFWYGINIYGHSNYNSISGNTIANNFYDGISLGSSSNNSINGNNLTNNSEGVWLDSSANNSISENNITNNLSGIGLWRASNNYVSGNTFTVGGLAVSVDSYSNSVENNTVNGRPLVYLEGVADYSIGDAGQVVLVRCDRIRVENLNLSRTSNGVQLWATNNSIVSGNNITATSYGILLDISSNNSLSGNNITNNHGGIWLRDSSYNSISGNIVTNSSDCGIYLSGSFNSISGNTITDNGYGIELAFSLNNSVCHNNFINNTVQVDNVTPEYANFWGNGCEGNYWRDYNGTDSNSGSYQNETGSDGIGDTSYSIDVNNIDNYPLMGMFSDFNATSEYSVQTICNSTISDFQFNGTVISFDVAGVDGTTGFCRICVPTGVMNVTYRVFVNRTEVSCNLLQCSNNTHSYLYFNYTRSTQEVIIIPEFPSFLILPLLFTVTLLVVVVCRKKGQIE